MEFTKKHREIFSRFRRKISMKTSLWAPKSLNKQSLELGAVTESCTEITISETMCKDLGITCIAQCCTNK